MTERLAHPGEAFAVVCTLALAVLAATSVRPGRWPVAVGVVVALVGSTASILAELATRRRSFDPASTGAEEPIDPGTAAPTVTTILRLGEEPMEVARTSILLSLQAGPTAVVLGPGRRLPDGLAPEDHEGLRVHEGETVEAATADAVEATTTEAVLLLSARAVPDAEHCRAAAALLDEDHDWVLGRSRSFGTDHYAPVGREELSTRLRTRAQSASVELWEPEATLVRTELLRAHPIDGRRPWGSWLRARDAEGHTGHVTSLTLSRRATPVGATAYWPDVMARQRGSAADLTDAAWSGPVRNRAVAALLSARELYAWAMLGWIPLLLVLAGSGRFPFEYRARWSILVLLAVALLRWWSLRAALGAPRALVSDSLAALYQLPGSIAALPSAVRRRVRPARLRFSTRPLVWAALFLTLLTGAELFDRDPTVPVSRVAVGTSLVTLGLLWLFSMRALVQRNWDRGTYRIPLDLEAEVGGVAARTSDGSPGGVAVRGAFEELDVAVGDEVDVRLRLDDGSWISVRGVVADRRTRGGHDLLGLSLQVGDAVRGPWVAQLLRSEEAVEQHETETPTTRSTHRSRRAMSATERTGTDRRSRLATVVDRAVAVVVVAVSLVVLGALTLVMLGYRPLVIRSASMTPTIAVGDVVLSEQVPLSELRIGDVVTQPQPEDGTEAITHRLVSMTREGDVVHIETKGDANDSGERWTVPADSSVGRVRAVVPWIGEAVIGVRNSSVQLVIGLVVLSLVVLAVLLPGRRSHPSDPDDAPADDESDESDDRDLAHDGVDRAESDETATADGPARSSST